MSKRIKWTDERIFSAAAEFDSRWAFQKGNNKAYQAASYRGILDGACKHMKGCLTNWTDEMLFEAACEFNTRSAFAVGNMNAYDAAFRRGLLGQVCAHMKRGVNGFNPYEPGAVYIVALDNPVQSYIGFGISNNVEFRLDQHYRNATREGFSLTLLKVINFDNGKDAYNLELKLKRDLPIINSGVKGFQTEAILTSDYCKLEELIHAN